MAGKPRLYNTFHCSCIDTTVLLSISIQIKAHVTVRKVRRATLAGTTRMIDRDEQAANHVVDSNTNDHCCFITDQ